MLGEIGRSVFRHAKLVSHVGSEGTGKTKCVSPFSQIEKTPYEITVQITCCRGMRDEKAGRVDLF